MNTHSDDGGAADALRLTEKAAKLARKGRPWFYSDEVASGALDAPGLVRIADPEGRPLGLGLWSPSSRLALRFCGGWEDGQLPTPADFLRRRLATAISRRAHHLGGSAPGVRLVHGESDGLPGLVIDRYADGLVLQITSAALERWRAELVDCLVQQFEPRWIVARNDVAVRRLEGLDHDEIRLLHGRRVEEVEIDEAGLRHPVRPFDGHKTGFYLDQRPARAWVRDHARGRTLLDAFCYQGGFALSGLHGGAVAALAVDESAPALQRAVDAAERNGLAGLEPHQGNAFQVLRELRRDGRQFGMVVIDPPAFAKSRREVDGALTGYRDLNRSALRLLEPGGLLVTCSCSHHVTPKQFGDVVRHAAGGLPFRALLRERIGAGDDHPVWLALPESEYLKVLVIERAD